MNFKNLTSNAIQVTGKYIYMTPSRKTKPDKIDKFKQYILQAFTFVVRI